jgi:hypothetical protein
VIAFRSFVSPRKIASFIVSAAIFSFGEDLEIAQPSPMRSLSKFFAVLLVVLAVSPFTAPFSSCDLATLFGDGTQVDGHDTLKDSSIAGAVVDAPARIDDHATIFRGVRAAAVPASHIAPTVLRV